MHRSWLRRAGPLAALFAAAVAISCSSDITGPSSGSVRYARGLSFQPVFAGSQQGVGAFDAVPFSKVRIVLHRENGTIALDTVVDFPPNATELTLSLDIQLSASAPLSGEPLSLNLAYVNAAGDTVFRGGPIPIIAVPSVAGAPPPLPVNIPVTYTGPGSTAASVAIAPRSLTVFAGDVFSFTAQALDGAGAVLAGTPIVFTSSNPALAELTSSSGGSGTTKPGRGTATITAQLLTGPSDVGTILVQPRPTAIVPTSGSGQSGAVSSTLAQSVVARVVASDGLGVAGVLVTFSASGNGSPGTTTVPTNADGFAQTTWKLGTVAGLQTMTATAAGVTGQSASFTATGTPLAATKLTVISQPSGAPAGTSLGAMIIAATDINSNVVTTFAGSVTVAIGTNPSGGALSGTTSVTMVDGQAAFTNLSINKAGTAYTLVGTTSGLPAVTSSPFDITSGQAVRLDITTQPSNGVAGATLAPVVLTARDAGGAVATSFTGTVVVSLGSNSSNATLSGTTSVNAVAGVATFSSLRINKAGTAYPLLATSTGLGIVQSTGFNIAPAAAAKCVLLSGENQTGIAGNPLGPITVATTDAFDNALLGVNMIVGVTAGGGSVASASVSADQSGPATIAWTLGATIGVQSLSVTCPGVATPLVITANAIPGVAGAATHLAFTSGPNTATAGTVNSPAILVTAQDINNLTATSYAGNVTIALSANPGGSTIIGTLTKPVIAGVATFNDIRLNKIGSGYTLHATSGTLLDAFSPGFTIIAAPALSIIADSGDGQAAPTSTLLPNKIVARVLDSLGNPVAGRSITLAVATGGGSLAPTGVVFTDANGRVRSGWTLGAAGGAQTATATSAGLAGSPVTFTATGTGGPTSIVWNGSVSQAWTNAANWTPAQVPSPVDSVTIVSVTNSPSITTPVTVHHLVLRQCALMGLTSTLTVTGHMVDSAFACGGPGTTGGVVREPVKGVRPVKRAPTANDVSGTGTLVLTGTGDIAGTLNMSNIQITGGTHTIIGSMTMSGTVAISGTGRLNGNGFFVSIGTLNTTGSGTIQMQNPSGHIFVTDANFAGGSETGLLTDGMLVVDHNFTATGLSFDATGNHETRISSCDNPQTLTFTAPVAGHGFRRLVFECGGGKIVSGAPNVTSDLTVLPGSATVTGGAGTVTIGGDLVDLSGNAPGWAVANTIMSPAVTARISPAIYQTNLTITSGTVHPDADAFTIINGNVTVTGATAVLDINGSELDILNNFSTVNGGKLRMADVNDVDFLFITGNASFAGGSTAGLLTHGFMSVDGNFSQGGPGSAGDSFAPTLPFGVEVGTQGTFLRAPRAATRAPAKSIILPKGVSSHTRDVVARAVAQSAADRARLQAKNPVRAVSARAQARLALMTRYAARRNKAPAIAAAATKATEAARRVKGRVANLVIPSTVEFGNPGTGPGTSHFADLFVVTNELDMASSIFVEGTLLADDENPHLFAAALANVVLTSRGANVFAAEFNNVQWLLLEGSDVSVLDDVSFTNMDPTVNQMEVRRSGTFPTGAVPSFHNWTFETVPTTGHYLSLTDIDGPTPDALVANMVAPSPGTSGGFVETFNGASTNWFGAFVWIGLGTTDNWDDAGNWNTETIPGPFDDVTILSSAPRQPNVNVNAIVQNLTIQNGQVIFLDESDITILGNIVAPVNAPAGNCTGGGDFHLVGNAAFNTVNGWFCNTFIEGTYKIAGPNNQLVVSDDMLVAGNIILNGGRLDVGGIGGVGFGEFITAGSGVLTMTNPADLMYVGAGGAIFQGASTTGLLTAGTLTIVNGNLRTDGTSTAPDAFAPSGTHTTAFTGSGTTTVGFFNPVASWLNNVDIQGTSQMLLDNDLTVHGTLAHSGIGTAQILTPDAGVLYTMTTSGLNNNTQPLLVSSVAIKLIDGTANTTFNNVTWEDFPFNFTGNVFDVNRSGAGTLTFTNHNFVDVTLGAGGHWLVNRNSMNVHMATPTPGTVTTQVQQIGTGVITWP